MDDRYIALSVPAFAFLIIVEILAIFALKRPNYRLHESVSNLGCGVGQVVLSVAMNIVVMGGYLWVYNKFHFFQVPETSVLMWILCFLAVDFCHYWFHRASHRVNFLWAGHAVHHQSEDYNLTAALRQSWLEPLTSLPFYLPMALVGFNLKMFVITHSAQILYQFWIHTETVKKLGPLEWFLNTPSAHRVHHAIDPEYIDKNYAGVFSLWDRMLGTFRPETFTPTYGTVKPLESYNPLWANMIEWLRIAALMIGTKSGLDRWYAPFAPPEWRPNDLGGVSEVPPVDHTSYKKYHPTTTVQTDIYVFVHFLLVVVGTALFLWYAHDLPTWKSVGIGFSLLLAINTLPGLGERKFWARPLELFRLSLLVPLLWVSVHPAAGIAAIAIALFSLRTLSNMRVRFGQ